MANNFKETNIQKRCSTTNQLEKDVSQWAKTLPLKFNYIQQVNDGTVGSGANSSTEEQHNKAKFSEDLHIKIQDYIVEDYAEFENTDAFEFNLDIYLNLKSKLIEWNPSRVLKNEHIKWFKQIPNKCSLILDYIDYKKIINFNGVLVYWDKIVGGYYIYEKDALIRSVVSARYKEWEGDHEESKDEHGNPTKGKIKSKIVIDKRTCNFRCDTFQEVSDYLEGLIEYRHTQRKAELDIPLDGDCVLTAYSPAKVGKIQPYVIKNNSRVPLQEGESVICNRI